MSTVTQPTISGGTRSELVSNLIGQKHGVMKSIKITTSFFVLAHLLLSLWLTYACSEGVEKDTTVPDCAWPLCSGQLKVQRSSKTTEQWHLGDINVDLRAAAS